MPEADSNSAKRTSYSDFGTSKRFAKELAERPFEAKTTIAVWRDQPRLQMNTRTWLARSPINEHVSDYCSYLRRRRYAEQTIRVYVCCAAHFACRMKNQRVCLRTLDRSTIEQFLSTHLPRCGCSRPVRKGAREHKAALRHLLKVLQESGAIAARQRSLCLMTRTMVLCIASSGPPAITGSGPDADAPQHRLHRLLVGSAGERFYHPPQQPLYSTT
jgi:hypothetical protein